MGRQRNRKGGMGIGALKAMSGGEKRARSEDGGEDAATGAAPQPTNDRNVWKTDSRVPSTLNNSLFESYYKKQAFFNKEVALASGWIKEGTAASSSSARPGEERFIQDWDIFYSALKQPLPSAIRINSNHPDRLLVRDMLFRELQAIGMTLVDVSGLAAKTKKMEENKNGVATAEGEGDGDDAQQQEVYPLNYVPEGLAFQLDLSKGELKRDGQFKRVKKLIAALNEGGYLTRQEAVSMIPPLMLDVRPGMRVLDMCAAPGSKTSQLLEAVIRGGYNGAPLSNAGSSTHSQIALDNFLTPLSGGGVPEVSKGGCVVANDVNVARIDVLHHQTGRAAHSHPNLIVTNNDATNYPLFPVVDSSEPSPKYDRVLCDVMCSGDGTLRKSIDLWVRWNPLQGADLHSAQLKTLLRGMSLVKEGGVVVYSTCSMNPLEDEAVVAEALLTTNGAFELIDKFDAAGGPMPELLKGLNYVPGVTDWTLSNREGTREFVTFADAFTHRKDEMKGKGFNFRPSMFPPHKQAFPEGHKTQFPDDREPETYDTVNNGNYTTDPLNLNRCIRVLPHQQNTGGFFIAAFRCRKDYNHEEQRRLIKERRQAAYQERTGTVGGGAASIEKVQQQVAAQAEESRKVKPEPLYHPIPAEMQACVQAVLPSISTSRSSCALPLPNLFIRRGQGLDKSEDADEDADKTGSRNVKVFMGTSEAAACLLDFPKGVIVRQIGAKVMESYVKYHPEKLRVWPETLDTLLPYLGNSVPAPAAANPAFTYLFKCDSKWLLDVIAAQAVTLPGGAVQSGKGRINMGDMIKFCTPLSVVVGPAGRIGVPQAPFKDAEDCARRLPPKSFILVVPIADNVTPANPSLPNTLAGFQPLNVSCELDDGNVTASIKITPHQLSLLQLFVTGDNTAVVGEKEKVAAATVVVAKSA